MRKLLLDPVFFWWKAVFFKGLPLIASFRNQDIRCFNIKDNVFQMYFWLLFLSKTWKHVGFLWKAVCF